MTCCDESSGILKPALWHTGHITLFLFLLNFLLCLAMHTLGEDLLSAILLKGSVLQPFAAALVGLIPNCAASVLLTQLYLAGSLSFGALLALATGVVNGSLVAKFKLPPFVATLGTQTICRGVAQLVNNNMNTDGIEGGAFAAAAKAMRTICYHGSINIAGFKIYYPIIIALVLWAIFNFVLSYTRTGRHLYAVGSNMEASKLSGVNVSLTILKAYLVSAFNAGVVGLIVCAQTGTGTTNAGLSYETFAVAASVIGGISTMGGTGILSGVLVGASVWAVMDNGLQLIGTQVGLKNVIVGLIVIVCVLLDVIRRTGSFKKKAA